MPSSTSTTTTAAECLPQDSPTLFTTLESYRWPNDPSFRSGLSAILGPDSQSSSPAHLADLTLRARCFYYTRQFSQPIDYDAYAAWRAGQPPDKLSSLELDYSAASARADVRDRGHLELSSPPESASHTPDRGLRGDAFSFVDRNQDLLASATGHVENEGTPDDSDYTTVDGAGESQPQYPQSFADVMALIQAGKPIPGIKEVPRTILEGQGTTSRVNQRPKPWETKITAEHSAPDSSH